MTGDFFFMNLSRDSVSHVQGILKKNIIIPGTRKTNTNDQNWERFFYWVVIHGIKIILYVRLSLLRLNIVMNILWQYSHWRGLLLLEYAGVFFFCLFGKLENSFSQILHFISSSGWSMSFTYNSSSVYVLECIMFYFLSAYHTNNTYVFVVLETGQGFLNGNGNCNGNGNFLMVIQGNQCGL